MKKVKILNNEIFNDNAGRKEGKKEKANERNIFNSTRDTHTHLLDSRIVNAWREYSMRTCSDKKPYTFHFHLLQEYDINR